MAAKKAAPKKATPVKRGSSDSETLEQYKARLKLAEYQRGTHPRSAMGIGSAQGNKGWSAGFDYAKKAMENNAPSSIQYVDKKGRPSNIVGYYMGIPIDAKKKKKK
jgi:hypothetical protein